MSPLVVPIKGKAVFNNTIVEYLCDGGADYTINNRELFEKTKTQAPRTMPKTYKGSELEPCKRIKRFETKLDPIEEEKTEMEIVRQEAYEPLEKQFTTSLADLYPPKNSRVAFKIRLLDPYMHQIRCRVRRLLTI